MQRIKLEPIEKVDPNNYDNLIEGSASENIFCAFLGLAVNSQAFVTPEQFFRVYRLMVSIVSCGMEVDVGQQLHLKGTKIFKEIRTLEGKENDFLKGPILRKITAFLSGGNEEFCDKVVDELNRLEALLLLSTIMPGSQA